MIVNGERKLEKMHGDNTDDDMGSVASFEENRWEQ
jgi:hypothetical protein